MRRSFGLGVSTVKRIAGDGVALKIGSGGLYAAALTLGLAWGTAMAAEEATQPSENLPPHKTPHTAEPPTGGHANLAEAATNPIANLIQFQVQNQYNWSNHNSDGYSNAAIIQPVVPIKLPWEAVPLVITRTTLPYVTTPDLGPGVGREKGFGDTTFLSLFTPNLGLKGQMLGLGPTFVIPTAGDNDFTGSGKWQAGPAAVYINTQTSTQWGLFAFQNWAFASSRSNSTNVNKLSIQPILTHHFDGGWYVGTPDNPQVYDFRTDKWTLQLGPQVGRVFKIGAQPVKLFGAVYHNPIDDNGPTAKWTAKIGLTFLFPE
jgi:hypothetical protein